MRDQISPTQFIPFNLPLQPDRKLRRSRQIRLSSLLNKSTFSADLINSTLSFMRVVEREWYEAQRTSVDDEKYGKLEKVISLPSKCSVCQESSGGGIKLNCKDEFQKQCIKSWWQILFLSEWQLNPMPLSSTLASEPTPSPVISFASFKPSPKALSRLDNIYLLCWICPHHIFPCDFGLYQIIEFFNEIIQCK